MFVAVRSTDWLRRQERDPFVKAARKEGLRTRASFKLEQLDDKYHFLRRGAAVVDLGAAPGGWTELAARRVNAAGRFPATVAPSPAAATAAAAAAAAAATSAAVPKAGTVVAVDLRPIDPVPGVTFICGDMLQPAVRAQVRAALGRSADVVLSDMYPATTGNHSTDHARTIELADTALRFARGVLAPGGCFVVKLNQGGEEQTYKRRVERYFTVVRRVKPEASRAQSPEFYIFASGFRDDAMKPVAGESDAQEQVQTAAAGASNSAAKSGDE